MKRFLIALLAGLLILAAPALAREQAPAQPAGEAAGETDVQPTEAPTPKPTLSPDIGQDKRKGDSEDGEETVVVMTLVEPPKPLAGVKIGIDPGHQAHGNSEKETVAPNSKKTKAKVSSGTSGVSTHIPEYKTVLEISLKLREALEEKGAEVYMTRDSHDVNISNQQRAKMMNKLGVDLVLRIHCDGADNSSANGIALYCSHSNSIAAESYRAAEYILPRVCQATGAKQNRIVSNDEYTGQNWSTVPCIMVECGFMSNPQEDRLLNDPEYQWKLANGLTDGIIDYIQARDARSR